MNDDRVPQSVIDSWWAESERLYREGNLLESLAAEKKLASDKYAALANKASSGS